jgi:hypothetical protein
VVEIAGNVPKNGSRNPTAEVLGKNPKIKV